MADKPHWTAEEVAAAITRAAGIKAYAAKFLGCNRDTVDNYCKRYAACRDAVRMAREALIDSAEGKLTQAVALGDLSAVKFVLTTIGKDRGYVERQPPSGEVTIEASPGALRVRVVYDDLGDAATEQEPLTAIDGTARLLEAS